MNHRLLAILCVSAGLLAGCAEYKEYRYRDFMVSREQAYDAVRYVLDTEGYEVVTYEENWVNDLPESYLETTWNMRQTGNPYPGNDVRRKAYVKITTRYSDRKPVEYQPLTEEEGEALDKLNEEIKRKADIETTRISIAVRSERRSDLKRPLESEWIYQGPDGFEVMALMGRLESTLGTASGGMGGPTDRGMKLKEDRLRSASGN